MSRPLHDRSLPLLFIGFALAACGDDASPAASGGGGASGATDGATSSGDGGSASSGDTGGSGSSSAQEAYCEDLVAHDASCGEETTVAECRADILTVCIFEGMRDGVADAVAACILERACDAEGDLEVCVYGPGQEQPIPEQLAWKEDCLAKREDCGDTYADDDCYVSFLRAEAYAGLEACLDEACAEVPTCTRSATETACQGE